MFSVNDAVQVLSVFIVTVQVPVPEQAPLQPVNVELASAVAVKVTVVPGLYASLQSAPQPIPEGLLVTVPVPVPALVTVSVYCTPVPLSCMSFDGVSGSLDVMFIIAVFVPPDAGVNTAFNVQVCAGGIVLNEHSSFVISN